MQNETVTVIFNIVERNESYDLEIPLFISANDLVVALDYAFNLGIDVSDVKNCYLQAERPIALLKGEKSLRDYGLRNGSVIYYRK